MVSLVIWSLVSSVLRLDCNICYRLRALSDGGGSVTSPPPSPGFAKFKLAEHRYGREEMLALFIPNTKPPERLDEFPALKSDKPLHPLAFLPLTEDEQVCVCLYCCISRIFLTIEDCF